jgi:Na+(H+)/acetate symporter ActP
VPYWTPQKGLCNEHDAWNLRRHLADHAWHHTYWAASRTATTSGFYAAGGGLTAARNGFALAGDWRSAAAFLEFTGLTALYGMDGAFYALGPLVAFCTVLFLIAEPMLNSGKYTLGDIVRSRMQTRTSLLAVIVGTVVVNFAYLMPAFPGYGEMITQIWRLKQVEYTWHRSLMRRYEDFSVITRDSLVYTLRALGHGFVATT